MHPDRTTFDVERVTAGLQSQNIDAVLLRTGQNISYLSGMYFPGTLGRLQDIGTSGREAVIVWPAKDEPTLFVSEIATPLARRESWIDDIRTFSEYSEDQFRHAAQRISELDQEVIRVGIERDELTTDQLDRIRTHLSDIELVDCSELLDELRAIKSSEEISLLREAARIQDAAYQEVFEDAQSGVTERELHSRLLAEMTRRGADGVHGMLQSNRTDVTYGGERAVRIRQGDVIRTDYVCYVDGYAANLSRMAVMGHPDSTQQEAYETVRDIHVKTIHTVLRSGVRAADVYDFVRNQFGEHDVDSIPGLVGHGIGVWWHQEQPILRAYETQCLRPGMVVCLEPILNGFWHLQDEILITEGEPELLSNGFNTEQLFVI